MNEKLFIKFQNFRSSLNNSTLEREEIVDGLLATLLSKQNAFLLGEPGTGKSDLVRNLCSGIEGANYFGYLLTPTTDPSEVFGPVAVTKLLKDEYTRDTDGYLPSAHIAFLDELFRGSSAILNSLLTLLNERTFNNGKQNVQTPIQSIIAATNMWAEEESLQAFADRFLFRPTVKKLRKPASKALLDQWAAGIQPRPEVNCHLTLDELSQLQTEAADIKLSDQFLTKFGSVWEMLEQRSISISDRRRVQIIKFLKAWALVQGDDELSPEHMHNSIVHIVYQTEEDKDIICSVLEQEIPTAERILNDARRAATGIMAEYSAVHQKHQYNSVSDLNDFVIQIRKFHKDMSTVHEKVNEVLDGSKFKMSVNVRSNGVKLTRQLQAHCETLAKAINDLTTS